MQDTRRRPDGPGPVRARASARVENLEGRCLLSTVPHFNYYQPYDFPPRTVQHGTAPISINHPLSAGPLELSRLDNDGKILSGTDRQGDSWTITLHGPGSMIITDATPADGVLDDNINKIQLIGTDPQNTYVTGEVSASDRLITDGIIFFDRLESLNGVASIILNGFTLADTVPDLPTDVDYITPEIYLPGGVGLLQFHNIESFFDLSTQAVEATDIVIGEAGRPLATEPTIRLDSIFNTTFDGSIPVQGTMPPIRPTVNILVNGQLHGLEFVSSTAAPVPAGLQFAFNPIATTGRTAVRAVGIDNLEVVGSARNFTASRQNIPFRDGFSGLDHLNSAKFGGNADAVGLDVAGPIHQVVFARGLGNPAGLVPSTSLLGLPTYERGYPSYGLLGGLVTANKIDSVTVAQANTTLRTGTDPTNLQRFRQGSTDFTPDLGTALTRSAIVSADSIGHTNIVGNGFGSIVTSGTHYNSFVAGLEPVRAPSRIGTASVRGDLIDEAIASTYRPGADRNFTVPVGNVAGPGRIRGHFSGVLLDVGAQSPLNTTGSGFYARTKVGGYQPPPRRAVRVQGVLVNT